MLPVLFELGAIEIRSYTLLVDISIIVGAFFAYLEVRRVGFNLNKLFDIVLVAVVSGIIGSRIYYIILNWPEFETDWTRLWQIWLGGLAFDGGFVGGAVGLIVYAWRQKLPLWFIADFSAIGVAIGQAIGRLGCFLNGCCYGVPTQVPWGVIFPVIDEDHRHPTQIYEAAGYLTLFLVLWMVRKRKPFDGFIFAAYLAVHGAIRLAVENLRDDSVFLEGFRVAQLVAFGEIVIALCIFIYLWRKATSLRSANAV